MSALDATWGRFELPESAGRRLALRMAAWTLASAGTAVFVEWTGLTSAPVSFALVTAAGVLAARPARPWLLPAIGLGVFAATWAAARSGLPAGLAAGGIAGLAVGSGGPLARAEGVLAGIAGGGIAHVLADQLTLSGLWSALALGTLLGAATAQSLVPGALHFAARYRLPAGRHIARTLTEAYRGPCYRALALDAEVTRRAPDREAREGLAEVGGWVYRLALTLQTLDADIGAIDPTSIRARAEALAGEEPDAFIAERRRSTRAHLERLLHHREALVRERARAVSLQEYALAWLEEARAGLALAQRLPAEASPEALDVVLERLRSHAAEVGGRRASVREVDFV